MTTTPTFRSARQALAWGLLLAGMFISPTQAAIDYSTPYVFTTFAGLASVGSDDGAGSAARFNRPAAVATDSSGNIYVTDSNNFTIRKITPTGIVSTVAGTPGVRPWNPLDGPEPTRDGTGSAARFNSPAGLAVDPSGNIYVADENTIRKITPAGVVTTFAGMPGSAAWGTADGTGSAASFNSPEGVATDAAGNVYVADTWNHAIRKITPAGVVSTLAGKPAGYPPAPGSIGSADGTGSAAQFTYPRSLAVDADGNVYVADTYNNTIRKISAAGSVTTFAGLAGTKGSTDGTGSAARFDGPYGVTVDRTGNVFVADNWNRTVRKITPSGVVTTLAGTAGIYGSTDGPGSTAQFGNTVGVAADGTGNIFVADIFSNVIRKISLAGVVSTFAGVSAQVSSGNADGPGSTARFSLPQGTAVDAAGNVYVADTENQAIRKISAAGVVSTLAVSGTSAGSSDLTSPAPRLFYPSGIATTTTGDVIVANSSDQNILKISATGIISTLAGSAGDRGFADGPGTAARFDTPRDVAVDRTGNVYVSEWQHHAIRKITPAGEVSTLAGIPDSMGFADGPGSSARFYYPEGLAIDAAGNVYVADNGNRVIRKISPTGTVSTLAGAAGVRGWNDGNASEARFERPEGLAIDSSGNLYVTDNNNLAFETKPNGSTVATDGDYVIRKITPAGMVTTLAGKGRGSSDGLGSKARFDMPVGIAVDAAGNVYVSCTPSESNTIRKGRLAGPPVITTQPQSQTVAAGGSVQITVNADAVPAPTYQWYVNGSPFSGATGNTLSFANARSADAGDYTVIVTNELGAVTSAKATLTISAAPTNPPANPPAAGGGGAIEPWLAIALAGLLGLSFRRR